MTDSSEYGKVVSSEQFFEELRTAPVPASHLYSAAIPLVLEVGGDVNTVGVGFDIYELDQSSDLWTETERWARPWKVRTAFRCMRMPIRATPTDADVPTKAMMMPKRLILSLTESAPSILTLLVILWGSSSDEQLRDARNFALLQ